MGSLFENPIVQVSFISWAIAQIMKIIIDFIRYKTVKLSLIVSSGGMPSSHSSCVTAMATGIGFLEGFNSSLFGIAFVISMIVMYDAAGVRRAAGKQAAILNIFIRNSDKHGIKIDETLKELLGHTPLQVLVGALLGIGVAWIKFL